MSVSGVSVGSYAEHITNDPVIIESEENWTGAIRLANSSWRRLLLDPSADPDDPTNPANVWAFDVGVARDFPASVYMLTTTPGTTKNFFWLSDDYGQTWIRPSAEPAWGDASYLDSPQDGHCYVASSTGIWKTTDHGSNWTKILDTSGEPIGQQRVDVLHVGTTKLWYSMDRNSTANFRQCNLDGTGNVNIPGPANSVDNFSIHIRALSDLLAVGNAYPGSGSAKLWKIQPGGATEITPAAATVANWYVWASEIIDALTYVTLIEDRVTSSPNIDRIYRTTDGGSTWSVVYTFPVGQGPTVTAAASYRHIVRSSSNPLFVACHGRASSSYQQDILISRDGGATWAVEKNTADITWGQVDPVNYPGDTTRLFAGPGNLSVQ